MYVWYWGGNSIVGYNTSFKIEVLNLRAKLEHKYNVAQRRAFTTREMTTKKQVKACIFHFHHV